MTWPQRHHQNFVTEMLFTLSFADGVRTTYVHRWLPWTSTAISPLKHLRYMSTVYCAREAHPQCVDVVANRKTPSLEDGCLETDTYFAIDGV